MLVKSMDSYLLKNHKVPLEQLIFKPNNFQQYTLSVMPKEKQKDLRRCLEVIADTENETSIKYTSIINLIAFIDEILEKKTAVQKAQVEEPHLQSGGLEMNWTPKDKFRAKYYSLDPDAKWQD